MCLVFGLRLGCIPTGGPFSAQGDAIRVAPIRKQDHTEDWWDLDGFGLRRKSVFEIMGQAGVFPATYPNGAKMALGRPTCRN